VNAYERTFLTNNDFSPFVFLDSTDKKTFTAFSDCFYGVLDGTYSIESLSNAEALKTEFDSIDITDEFNWGISFNEFFFPKYECSGICKIPLFEWNNIVPGDHICKYELRDELKLNFEFLAVILLISAGASLCAFVVQYYMWRDYRVKFDPIQLHF